MKASELKDRTKGFAVSIIKLVDQLPANRSGKTVATPLIRCGTALGSTYRSACKSRNTFDFMARLGLVEETAEDCCYWLELIIESQILKPEQVQPTLDEAIQLKKILTKSRRAAVKRFRHSSGEWEEDSPF